MALIDRLGHLDRSETANNIPSSVFHALLYELSAGQVTKQQIINYFALDAGEQNELDFIIARYNAQPTAAAKEKFVELIRILFILAEAQVPGYVTNSDLVARIDAI